MRRVVVKWFYLGVLCSTCAAQGTSTDGTTPPADPALTKLQTQQAMMDAKVAILQDQQKLTTGVLPGSGIQPKEGSIKADGRPSH
jgi:hypothetical protein